MEERRAVGLGCYWDFLSHCHYFLSHYCCHYCFQLSCYWCSPRSPLVSRPQSTPPSPPSLAGLGPLGWGNGREGPRVRTEARRELWWSWVRMEGRRPEEALKLYELCHGNWPEGGASAHHCAWSPRWLFGADAEEEIRVRQSGKEELTSQDN